MQNCLVQVADPPAKSEGSENYSRFGPIYSGSPAPTENVSYIYVSSEVSIFRVTHICNLWVISSSVRFYYVLFYVSVRFRSILGHLTSV